MIQFGSKIQNRYVENTIFHFSIIFVIQIEFLNILTTCCLRFTFSTRNTGREIRLNSVNMIEIGMKTQYDISVLNYC